MKTLLRVALVVALSMMCLAAVRADDPAQKATLAWLHVVDGGDYAASYKQASAFFQKSITEESWVGALKQTRAPLGKVLSRKIVTSQALKSVPGAPAGDYVVTQLSTDFEKKKGATETVTVMKVGTAWKMAGYFIR